ncbi:hypothetical protein FKW77_006416 [Venturia effusa]|uniref:Uncharacterized protein n=1 Tax=Venturia effusa TaxID=50376 RepID=A0A517LLN3_9PEZI|nr:hypothetical protein FKW77_006416 [Venturia effusa]
MATAQDAPTKYIQYVPLGHELRRPYVWDAQGRVALLNHEAGFPWILTSMLPEDMGPRENPDDFLPQTINESSLDEITMALWKAKSGRSSSNKNGIVKAKILPRLDVAAKKKFNANTLNNRDQRFRMEHGIFNGGFHVSRMVAGVEKVPEQVSTCIKKHSAVQWLHRTWGDIHLENFTYNCEGTVYQLRAPMDLPPRIVEVFGKLGLVVPKVRDYLEARLDVWKFFFGQHHGETMKLRETDPSAFLPLPGYVSTGDGSDQVQDLADEKDDEEDREEQAGSDGDEDAIDHIPTPEASESDHTASNPMAWLDEWNAECNHLSSCTVLDNTCERCKKFLAEIEFDKNLMETLNA